MKKFSVDLAFGPEHDNKEIYSVVGLPLVHLALQVINRGVTRVLFGEQGRIQAPSPLSLIPTGFSKFCEKVKKKNYVLLPIDP